MTTPRCGCTPRHHDSLRPRRSTRRQGSPLPHRSPRRSLLAAWSALVLVLLGATRLAAQHDPGVDSAPLSVAIFVFPGVELLDFAGPGEVFAATPNTTVYTLAESREPVVSMGFLDITPDHTLADAPAPDVIVLPGGNVRPPSPELRAWLHEHTARRASNVVMSVCNGALFLADVDLLAGLDVTTHHSAFESLALREPRATVFRNRRYIDSGQVLTTAGISAGIDGALHLVRRLRGEDTAWQVARYMEYDWRPDEIAAEFARPGETVGLPVSLELALALRDASPAEALASQRASIMALRGDARVRTERVLNLRGYALLRAREADAALALFRLQVELFPESANPHESLADAYEQAGEHALAVRHSRRALELLEGSEREEVVSPERIRQACEQRLARLAGAAAVSDG